MIHLGIDTSNYKTSLAAVDEDRHILSNISEYLDVPKGERGLRQSDAFFKHSNKLPFLTEKLLKTIDAGDVSSVGVSYAPRRVEGSYMPCFLAGVNLGKVISELLGVPCYEFSHQEGHAAAIIDTTEDAGDDPVILMHLSGGTTEFLKCTPSKAGYNTEIVGGSLDISFGQLIDRFGVAIGLPFPAGPEMDKIAETCEAKTDSDVLGNIRVKDGYFNLSGPETRLMGFASSSKEKDLRAVIFEIMDKISDILIESSDYLCEKYGTEKVYMAGGVASSITIRKLLKIKQKRESYRILFGDPALSGDNAVGTAILAGKAFNHK